MANIPCPWTQKGPSKYSFSNYCAKTGIGTVVNERPVSRSRDFFRPGKDRPGTVVGKWAVEINAKGVHPVIVLIFT